MKYTFTEKEFSLVEANRLLVVLWGTTDDDKIHESCLEDFTKDRIELYGHLGKRVTIKIDVGFE